MSRQAQPISAGFTLAEVLIVIVIIGILSTIALDISTKAKQRAQVNALAINLAGWLNQVRKSSLRGSGCSVQIISPISAESTIAKSAIASSTTTALNAANACLANQPLTMTDINPSASQVNYTITQTPSDPIVFTPRGSVSLPSGSSSINLEIKLMPSGPSRCVSIQGLIANINISKGGSCGNQERF